MTTEICPIPGSDDEPKHESPRDPRPPGPDAHSDRRRRRASLSRDECLEAIAALPGLVAMRILSPAQANSIRATYAEILRHHDRAQQGHATQLADDDVLKLWHDHPQMIDLLQPLLTQSQLELIMRESRDDDRKA
jgi:hypothetical protein